MKRSIWILGVAVLSVVGSSAGCNKAAPTEPVFPANDATAVSFPVNSLSGAWSGTIRFYAYNGDYVVLLCGDETLAISLILTQDGNLLTGHFQSSCDGVMEIHGVVDGERIAGTLDSPTKQDYGTIFGTISANQIRFKTIKYIDEHGDGLPDDDGDGNVVSSEVDLRRAAERASPIAVERGRSPRVLPAR